MCFLAMSCQDLAAGGMRCGRKLVSVGDSAGELARICGEPRHKDRGRESIRVRGVLTESRVERWYYKKSSRSLEHIVFVFQGKVAGVEVGSR
jgi:hypothetical protein